MIGFVGRWLGITGISDAELAALRAPAEKAVLKACLRFENGIKLALTGPRSGRMYGDHQASAPGEPPATWHGDLRKSITHSMPEWGVDNKVSGTVGTAIIYAAILEYGGMAGNGARILPRPYMEPTFLEMQDELEAILQEVVDL